ncbi:hypothetical protein [Paenibacillus dakarensis]|uniref:hypothetical protein n=1 Tax=Paenibacillus dakarensis TaxID=1527293 RepID=UPI0006D586FE|nr:hypothetical protein [Paenibacillus dakarensis]
MNLNGNKWLILQLSLNGILLFLSIVVFALHHARFTPSSFGFLYFLAVLGFAGVFVALIVDLMTSATRQVHGQIVHKEGRTIHISRTDGKLRKYKVTVPEVLQRLEKGQFVTMSLSKLAQIPQSIHIVDPPGEPENWLEAR